MKRLIFILPIALAIPVIAQTKDRPSLAKQKMCSEKVEKSFEPDAVPGRIFYTNHFDQKTETCYVAQWFVDEEHRIVQALLQDAFEGRVFGFFKEETGDCYIRPRNHDQIDCRSRDEFKRMVDKWFGIAP